MPLNLENKKAIVAEVTSVARDSVAALTAKYTGITVGDMTSLRAKARASGVYLRVVRNTLARRAVENTEFSCMHDSLTGPVVLAFARTEPSAAARLIRDFAKDNNKLEVTCLAVGGKLYSANDLEAIAKLPTKTEAIAMFLGTLQAPITKLVRTLAEPHAKLVRTFAAVRDQKQQQV